jgi:hypothetical protein
MLEILKFIFSSFWIWLGTLIILTGPAAALGGAIAETFKRNKE